MSNKDPLKQILENNPWYTDDQFAAQLESPGKKIALKNRWNIFESIINSFLSNLKVKTLKILDSGCGDGINLFALSQIARKNNWDFELYGIDYNPLRVERARKIGNVVEVKESSIIDITYDDNYFDAILCNHVLEHISDYGNALREMKRILKPHGIIIIGVPNEGCLLAQIRNNIIQPSIAKTTDHINFFTKSSLKAILNQNGFQVIDTFSEGFFMPHLSVNNILVEKKWGRFLISMFAFFFPSQVAGLIFVSKGVNE